MATGAVCSVVNAAAKGAKRKLGFVVAYDGCYFRGSQANAVHETVDAALLHALHTSGFVRPDAASLNWSRSSRTDSGVHALCATVTCKVRLDPAVFDRADHAPSVAAALNRRLPPFIRVISAVRVSRGFNARSDAASRVYHYFIPAEALLSIQDGEAVGISGEAGETLIGGIPKSQLPNLLERVKLLDGALAAFRGSSSFHNFTLPGARAQMVYPSRRVPAPLWLSEGSGGSSSRCRSIGSGIDPSSGTQPQPPAELAAEQDIAIETASPSRCEARLAGTRDRPVTAAIVSHWAARQAAASAAAGAAGSMPLRSHVDTPFARCYAALFEGTRWHGGRASTEEERAVESESIALQRCRRGWEFTPAARRVVFRSQVSGVYAVEAAAAPSLAPQRSGGAAAAADGESDASGAATTVSTVPAHALRTTPLSLSNGSNDDGRRRSSSWYAHPASTPPETWAHHGSASLFGQRWTDPPASSNGSDITKLAAAGTGSSVTGSDQRVHALVRVTFHGSAFLYNQIRLMVGTALAVLHGNLPPATIRAALALPLFYPLPLAPGSGLLQAAVHYRSASNVTLAHPPGVHDGAKPVIGEPLRERRMDAPRNAASLAAAADAPDVALLLSGNEAAQRQFFDEAILPRLAQFAGWLPLSPEALLQQQQRQNKATARELCAAAQPMEPSDASLAGAIEPSDETEATLAGADGADSADNAGGMDDTASAAADAGASAASTSADESSDAVAGKPRSRLDDDGRWRHDDAFPAVKPTGTQWSPVTETALAWLRRLPSLTPPPAVQDAAIRWFEGAWSEGDKEHAAARQRGDEAAAMRAAVTIYGREGHAPPSPFLPLHVQLLQRRQEQRTAAAASGAAATPNGAGPVPGASTLGGSESASEGGKGARARADTMAEAVAETCDDEAAAAGEAAPAPSVGTGSPAVHVKAKPPKWGAWEPVLPREAALWAQQEAWRGQVRAGDLIREAERAHRTASAIAFHAAEAAGRAVPADSAEARREAKGRARLERGSAVAGAGATSLSLTENRRLSGDADAAEADLTLHSGADGASQSNLAGDYDHDDGAPAAAQAAAPGMLPGEGLEAGPPLCKARLAEIHAALLPNGLSTALSLATGITRERDLEAMTRAVCWRIAQGEWPPVASAAQHAAWAATPPAMPSLLVREGRFLQVQDRAEGQSAGQVLQHVRRQAEKSSQTSTHGRGPLVAAAVSMERSGAVLPLQRLYEDRLPSSLGGGDRRKHAMGGSRAAGEGSPPQVASGGDAQRRR